LDFGIDYDRLSNLTENFVSSDIESIVNETTSIAMADDARITMDLLEKVIKSFKPFPIEELQKYQTIKAKMDGENNELKNERPRIGFKL
jgi:transitional endoplasmic reticulum ATPase